MSERFPLRVGVAVPQRWGSPVQTIARLHDFARRVETSGLDALWTQEQTLGRDPSFEPVAMLAHLAAVTSRVRLGVSAVVAPLRNPVVLAKQLATVDQLSAGRLDAGLVLGELRIAFDASGIAWSARPGRLDRAIATLRALWSGEDVDLEGAGPTRITPPPVQPGGPPLWLGAKSGAGLERVARLADGWLGAGGASIPDWVESNRRLDELLAARGRRIRRSKKVYLWIDDDEDVARDRLAEWFGVHWGAPGGGLEMAERIGLAGSASRVADRLAGLVAAGADTLVLNPVGDEERQLDRIVEDVLPQLPAE